MKKRILIKVSGASLKGENSDFDLQKVTNLAEQIKILKDQFSIGLVVGGGNIFRGNIAGDFNLERNDADYMGMLATMMNGLLIKNTLHNAQVESKIYSGFSMNKVADEFCIRNVKKDLDNGVVCIFTCGTGSPFFTTDSGAALRAAEIGADIILMGKNGVDGVYSDDPKKNKDAIRFSNLSYKEVLEKRLKVMDLSALTLCQDNNIEILVFNVDEPNAFVKALNNEIKTTIITK